MKVFLNEQAVFQLEALMRRAGHKNHQQSASSTGDKQEFRRATNIIEKLSTEYGASLLHEARAQFK